jgi:alpha-N-acetylglucosamine transferase
MGDSYLIGCLTLAQSVRQFEESKKIDLVCMVTPDVSNEAIQELKNFYDRVVPVEYIQIDRNKIRHSQDKVKDIYAKAFTKINCLQLIEYKKVLMIDVDMLVIKRKFFKIFDVKTPASPFIGCLVFYKKDILEIYKKEYSELKHGSIVPKKYYYINCQKLYDKYNIKTMAHIGIESTIMLFEPNLEDFNNLKAIVASD